VRSLWTTICCSAVALTASYSALSQIGLQPIVPPPIAQPTVSSKDTPLSPFPPAPRWTLALTTSLVAHPAFDGPTGYFPIEGDQIVAYDLTTGTPRWTVSAHPQPNLTAGGGLLFFADSEALVALHAADGSVAWRVPFPTKLVASPIVTQGSLVAATQLAVLSIHVADGDIAWKRDLDSPVHGLMSTAADLLFVPVENGRVLALRVDNGDPVWERRLGGAPNDTRAVDDQVFVGSVDNYMYCLIARTGRVDWRVRTGADVVSASVLDDRRVYFVSLDNVLRALNRGHGVQQWKRVLPFRPAWNALRAADTLVVVGLSGAARAFYLKDGAPAGEMSLGNGVELAAPLHAFDSNLSLGPIIVAVTRSLATGATSVTAASRSIEPPLLPAVQPLPGVLNVAVAEKR
jgi:outer membrane protein assembly factor BamB